MFRTLTLTTLVSLTALLGGCSSNADTICDRRKECFDSNLDVDDCADGIQDWQKEKDENDRQDRVAECAECAADRTCAEILASCIDDCIGIP